MNNILYFETGSGFGGSSVALASLTACLNRQVYHPIVVAKYHNSKIRYILPDLIELLRIIREEKISLVHINNNIIAGISAILASRLSGVKCICHIRNTRQLITREKYIAKWVDRFIAINKTACDLYKAALRHERIDLVYDGIDLSILNGTSKLSLREELNIGKEPIVGVVGRIVSGKGHREFVLAAKEIIKKRPDAKFVIVGEAKGEDDRCYIEVREIVNREGLSANVIFTGWRDDALNIINDIDVLVQPATNPEGFGLTCIEAMSLRKPVIATEVAGLSDIVVDGETGFLVPPGDVMAMANKILYLLNNPAVAQKMGELGRKRVEECFDIRKTVEKIETIYEEVLHG